MSDTLPILTAARRSLWDAINAWPALKRDPADVVASFFAKRITLDDDSDAMSTIEPAIGELPAITILPARVSPMWWLNQTQKFPMIFQVKIWLNDWKIPVAERVAEDVWNAIWRATPPGSTVTYVKAATGYYPVMVSPIDIRPARLGEERAGTTSQRPKITAVSFQVTLSATKNPFG